MSGNRVQAGSSASCITRRCLTGAFTVAESSGLRSVQGWFATIKWLFLKLGNSAQFRSWFLYHKQKLHQCSKNRQAHFVRFLEERPEDLYTICILPFGFHVIKDISRFVFQIETIGERQWIPVWAYRAVFAKVQGFSQEREQRLPFS